MADFTIDCACRWGYNNIYEWRGVIANYSAANIPLETMVSAIGSHRRDNGIQGHWHATDLKFVFASQKLQC